MSAESTVQDSKAENVAIDFVDLMTDCDAMRRFTEYDDLFGGEVVVPILYEP